MVIECVFDIANIDCKPPAFMCVRHSQKWRKEPRTHLLLEESQGLVYALPVLWLIYCGLQQKHRGKGPVVKAFFPVYVAAHQFLLFVHLVRFEAHEHAGYCLHCHKTVSNGRDPGFPCVLKTQYSRIHIACSCSYTHTFSKGKQHLWLEVLLLIEAAQQDKHGVPRFFGSRESAALTCTGKRVARSSAAAPPADEP